MNNIQKRFALFLFVCIPIRISLAFAAKVASPCFLKFLGFIGFMLSGSFFYLYLSGKRKTGFETFGAPIWWNFLRPVHGILYFLFSVSAIQSQSCAYLYLVVDVIVGFVSFIIFHFKQNNFSKVF